MDGRANAKLKLAAALLSANFDDLKQRDQVRRRWRRRVTISTSLILAAVAGNAWRQATVARQQAAIASAQAELAANSGKFARRALDDFMAGKDREGATEIDYAIALMPHNAFYYRLKGDCLIGEIDAKSSPAFNLSDRDKLRYFLSTLEIAGSCYRKATQFGPDTLSGERLRVCSNALTETYTRQKLDAPDLAMLRETIRRERELARKLMFNAVAPILKPDATAEEMLGKGTHQFSKRYPIPSGIGGQ